MRSKQNIIPQSILENNRRLTKEQHFAVPRNKKENENQEEDNDNDDKNEIHVESLAGNPEKIFQAIIQSIEKDDSKSLKKILYLICRPQLQGQSYKILCEDKTGRTPLWYAAYFGSTRCLKVIDRHFISVSSISGDISSIHHRPDASRHMSSIRGADIEVNKRNDNSSAIKDANLFHGSKWGTPPLLIAAARNHHKAVSYIISIGASTTQTNEYGTTAAHLAAYLGHANVLRVLKKHHQYNDIMNASNNLGLTPAMAAAKNGYVHILRYLHDECYCKSQFDGVFDFRKRDGRDRQGLDCAAIACYHNKASVVEYLLSICGVDEPHLPNFHAKFGRLNDTLLHITCRCGHVETLKVLLKAKNRFNLIESLSESNDDGMTAFHLAVHLKFTHIIECFRDTLDESSLELVTSTRDTVNHETPLIYAISRGYEVPFVQTLGSISDLNITSQFAGSDNIFSPPLVVAATRDDKNIVEILLLLGIDINQTDDRGHTAISVAARNGYADLCDSLALHGADLTIRTQTGGTPLQKARKYRHFNVVNILEKYGAT